MHRNIKYRHSRGSALLISLIVMGVLMTLSLGVSNLLIGTMRDSRLLLEKTRAFFAAESGIEHALADVHDNPLGFERHVSSSEQHFEYTVSATARQFPAAGEYATLRLNEAITIPLFRGEKPEDAVKHFRVNYYVTPDIALRGGQIDSNLDVLRWKIFGISQTDGAMEVINEFLPAESGNSSETPTCFGTASGCYNVSKFYERRVSADGVTELHKAERYPIETFLNNHRQNFLVLTNMLNTDLIAGSLTTREKQEIATIRYRVVEEDGDGPGRLTLPVTAITADGFSASTKQSLNVDLERESFLPVFNYALYRTAE